MKNRNGTTRDDHDRIFERAVSLMSHEPWRVQAMHTIAHVASYRTRDQWKPAAKLLWDLAWSESRMNANPDACGHREHVARTCVVCDERISADVPIGDACSPECTEQLHSEPIPSHDTRYADGYAMHEPGPDPRDRVVCGDDPPPGIGVTVDAWVIPTTWDAFRGFVAGRIRNGSTRTGCQSTHVSACADVASETDYEGPALNQFVNRLLDAWSDCEASIGDDDGYVFGEWWNDVGRDTICDAIIDAHPGLCPDGVADDAMRIMGVER